MVEGLSGIPVKPITPAVIISGSRLGISEIKIILKDNAMKMKKDPAMKLKKEEPMKMKKNGAMKMKKEEPTKMKKK